MSYQSLPTVGQKLMAASLPVVLASDQSTLPVSGTVSVSGSVAITAASLPLPSGAATSALQSAGNTSLANIDADLGAVGDAAASSDTGSFSLIALVKRLLTKLPAALGQTNMAGSLSVTLASNQSAVNVSPDNVLDNAVTTASVSSAVTVVSASTSGYAGGSFHVSSAGTGCTISYEQSNDGTNWLSLPVVQSNATSSSATGTSTAAGMYSYSAPAAFVRARVSTYGSGTVTVSLAQKRSVQPVANLTLGGSSATIGVLNAGSNTIGNLTRQSGFTDSSTALAAGATFTGTGRATTGANYSKFNAAAWADQAGTLFVELSTDTGANYRVVGQQAVSAGSFGVVSVPVIGAAGAATLYRVRYVNGATLQGAFQLSSSFTAA